MSKTDFVQALIKVYKCNKQTENINDGPDELVVSCETLSQACVWLFYWVCGRHKIFIYHLTL